MRTLERRFLRVPGLRLRQGVTEGLLQVHGPGKEVSLCAGSAELSQRLQFALGLHALGDDPCAGFPREGNQGRGQCAPRGIGIDVLGQADIQLYQLGAPSNRG